MSARQAFVPQRPQSSAPSMEKSTPDEGRGRDTVLSRSPRMMNLARPHSSVGSGVPESGQGHGAGPGNAMSTGGGVKSRSLVGLLGKRTPKSPPNTHIPIRPEREATSQIQKPRRSFDGIRRPEMTPLSLVPYPASAAPTNGSEDGSVPKNLPFASARGTATGQAEENSSKEGRVRERSDNEENNSGETAPGYMHLVGAGPGLTRATVGGNVNATGKNAVALTIAAPVPGYAQLGTDEIVGAMNASGVNERVYAMPAAAENLGNMDVGGDVGRIVAMAEGRRTVHLAPGLGYERESGTFTDHYQEERRPQKRARQSMDKEGFTMFSSPHMPLTPVPVRPPSQRDSLTTLETLFMDLDAFLNEGEFKAECERWRECTREEWLRGTEEWSKEFQGLLDLAKDHFTERMISYSSLSKDVADRRAELDRDMQIMNDGMKVVGENLACLAKTSKGRCS